MSSAAECRPFCLRANEIRYQYLYYRQKPGIYIYIYIFVWVYTLKMGGGGAVTMATLRHHRLSQWHGATSAHSRHTDSPPPTALPRLFMCPSVDFVLCLLCISCDFYAPVDKSDTIDKIIFMNVDVMKQYLMWLITSSNYRCASRRHVCVTTR